MGNCEGLYPQPLWSSQDIAIAVALEDAAQRLVLRFAPSARLFGDPRNRSSKYSSSCAGRLRWVAPPEQ